MFLLPLITEQEDVGAETIALSIVLAKIAPDILPREFSAGIAGWKHLVVMFGLAMRRRKR